MASRHQIVTSCSHFVCLSAVSEKARPLPQVGHAIALAPCALQVNVGAGSHPNKVKVYGPGVAKTGLKAHEPTYFTVDCTEAGQGKAPPQAGGHGGEVSLRDPSLCSHHHRR